MAAAAEDAAAWARGKEQAAQVAASEAAERSAEAVR